MPPRLKPDVKAVLLAALDTPENRASIAKRLGISRSTVSKYAMGEEKPSSYRAAAALNRRGTLGIGEPHFRTVLAGLPDHVLNWVYGLKLKDETLADTVRRIIIETHRRTHE